MSNVKPEQHTVMPPYPVGSQQPAPPRRAEVETAEQAGETSQRRELPAESTEREAEDPDPDEDQDDERVSAAAAEQRPPSDS
jgi:hypothetical protein